MCAGIHVLLIKVADAALDVSPWLAYPVLLAGVILAGALTGAAFPLSARAHLALGGETARSGGVIQAADHLGGALGAALIGSLLIPLMGIWGAMLVPAAAALLAALFLSLRAG
jgi:hypothetical protein